MREVDLKTKVRFETISDSCTLYNIDDQLQKVYAIRREWVIETNKGPNACKVSIA